MTSTKYTIIVGADHRYTPDEVRTKLLGLLASVGVDGSITETHGYTQQWGVEVGHTITLYGAHRLDAYDLAWSIRREFDQDEVWLVSEPNVEITVVGRFS